MIKTPIIFKLEDFVEDIKDPIIPQLAPPVIITVDNELALITKPLYLAPRYYLIIHAPSIIRNDTNYMPKPFTYHIPWEGIYKDEVRVALPPTVGWGEGSCYTVEYWEWIPQILPTGLKKTPIKKKCLKTEKWLVPHPSNRHLLNHNNQDFNNSSNLTSISLTSTGLPISLLSYKDLIFINRIDKTNNYSLNPVLATNVSLLQRTVNSKTVIDLLLTTDIAINETFTLYYTKPITIKNILFKNSLFPQNIYNTSV